MPGKFVAFVAIADRLVPEWTEDEVIDAVIMQKLLPLNYTVPSGN